MLRFSLSQISEPSKETAGLFNFYKHLICLCQVINIIYYRRFISTYKKIKGIIFYQRNMWDVKPTMFCGLTYCNFKSEVTNKFCCCSHICHISFMQWTVGGISTNDLFLIHLKKVFHLLLSDLGSYRYIHTLEPPLEAFE